MKPAILICLAIVAPHVTGQSAAPFKPTPLTIKPAGLPVPALKYQLLPDIADLVPGNAVVIYYRAFSPDLLGSLKRADVENKIADWGHTPLANLPRKDMAWLHQAHSLKEVDFAARHEQCDWQIRDRVLKEGVSLRLPDLQAFRTFGSALAARARLEIAEGDYDKAVYTFQTGFAMARHLNEGPSLLHGLVGIAIAGIMAEQLETLIQCPDAPNLFWALADLPRPMFDMRKTLLAEKLVIQAELPSLYDIQNTVMTSEQMNAAVKHAMRLLNDFRPNEESSLMITALAVKAYPQAKRRLIQMGRSPSTVEAMPAVQVVLINSLDEYFRLRDDLFKWANIPYYQAFEGLHQTELALRRSRETLEGGFPIAAMILPAVQKVVYAYCRVSRRIAALQCVEAIRFYVATHDGRFPENLADIKDLPIPVDPGTGKDFHYTVSDHKAILSGLNLPHQSPNAVDSIYYELTLTP